MPATGHPVIHAFEAVFDLSGGVERITALTVICRHCSETRSASEDNLVQLPGGALFRCDGCGSHQAVSHARVADWQVNRFWVSEAAIRRCHDAGRWRRDDGAVRGRPVSHLVRPKGR